MWPQKAIPALASIAPPHENARYRSKSGSDAGFRMAETVYDDDHVPEREEWKPSLSYLWLCLA
jgi:hypothetical protein